MLNINIIQLPSVGSAISSTGLIWPVQIDGNIDRAGMVCIEDASSEWFESLDSADTETVNHIITNNLN